MMTAGSSHFFGYRIRRRLLYAGYCGFICIEQRGCCRFNALSARVLWTNAPESWIERESNVVRGVIHGVILIANAGYLSWYSP